MNSVAPSLSAQRLQARVNSAENSRRCALPERLHRRAGSIRGQFQQRRRAPKMLLPVAELALQHLALQPLALPGGIVGILDRQLRQAGTVRPAERVVERGQLAHQMPCDQPSETI